MFVIDSDRPIPAPVDGLPGVTVYVKPCSRQQYALVNLLPNVPTDAERDEVLRLLAPHVDNITGLAVRVAGVETPVKSVADVLDRCPPWVLLCVYRAVLATSRLPAADLGKSASPSSGGESTTPETVPPVDRDD